MSLVAFKCLSEFQLTQIFLQLQKAGADVETITLSSE